MTDLKKLLNNEQYLSVTHKDGPSVILAGAGSGKTRVITYKIAYLISQGVAPDKILAVTFTNKAAKEMKERVAALLPKMKDKPFISTFHSLGLEILKHDIAAAGYGNKFSIYDDKDCMKIIKDILLELRLPEDDYDPYQTVSKMSLLKMNLGSGFDDPNYDAIFQKYQYNLKLHNAVDFDDLIKLPLEIFGSHPDILHKYQKKWDYILVDEYQDTSLMQQRECCQSNDSSAQDAPHTQDRSHARTVRKYHQSPHATNISTDRHHQQPRYCGAALQGIS